MDKSRQQLIEAIDKMIAVSKLKELDLTGCAYLEFRNPVVSGDDFEDVDVTTVAVPLEEMSCGFRGYEVVLTHEKFLNGGDKPVSTFKEVFSFREIV